MSVSPRLLRTPDSRRHSSAGAFQLYDINNDGLITYDEMLQIVQSIYDMTGEMVKLPADEDTAQKVPHLLADCASF